MKKLLIILGALFVLSACNFGRYTFIDSSKTEDVTLGKFFEIEQPYIIDGVPLGVVTSDNLVAGYDNARVYLSAAEVLKPSVVVVLAQDPELDKEIITCKKCVYHTGFGDLRTEKDLANQMIKATSVKNNSDYFAMEEAVADQTIFAKKVFPDANILPIVVGANVSVDELETLSEWLNDNLSLDTLVVFATHFSSDVQLEVASFHDSLAVSALTNFDYDNLTKLASDTYESTYLFLKLMEKRGFLKVQKLGDSNSAKTLNEHVEHIDSYQYLSFMRGLIEPVKSVSILSFGNLPKGHDMEFVAGHQYDPLKDPLSDITTSKFLKDIRGNKDGFLRGVDFLAYDLVNNDCRIDKKGELEIAFCRFDQDSNDKELLTEIGSLDVDLIYVIYKFNDGEVDEKIAKRIINGGADIFVGRGVDKIVPFERYKGGLIFYSLGNFITDSKLFIGDSVMVPGMVVGLYITPEYYDVYAFPVEVINGYPKIIDFSLRMREFLHFTSNLSTGDGDLFKGLMALVKLSR